ncbi:unnamed protein product [marine sediment metagenome]|uniref:Uncharacterized protein n=1 Tax=marine sediment metagenome TaxID=412755 RepID=X0UKT7_9ZZZZ
MVYKIISEYRNDVIHEITMYKYNLNHDVMMRYVYEAEANTLDILTQTHGIESKCVSYDTRSGTKPWYQYGNKPEMRKLF